LQENSISSLTIAKFKNIVVSARVVIVDFKLLNTIDSKVISIDYINSRDIILEAYLARLLDLVNIASY